MINIQPVRTTTRHLAVPLLLVAAAVTAIVSYVVFDSATKVPSIDFTGGITVHVSDPSIDVSLDATFYQELSVENGRIGSTTYGYENLRFVVLRLKLHSRTVATRPISCILAMSGDARLARIMPTNESVIQPRVRNVDQGSITFNQLPLVVTGAKEAQFLVTSQQLFQYDFGEHLGSYDSDISLVGELDKDLTQKEAGLRYVMAPDITTEPQPVQATFSHEFGIEGTWHGARKMQVTARVGTTGPRELVDSANPPFMSPTIPEESSSLIWSGTSLSHPRAVISDRSLQMNANRMSFLAGALAGVAGGFLIEAIIRTQPFTDPRRPTNVPSRLKARWPAARVVPVMKRRSRKPGKNRQSRS